VEGREEVTMDGKTPLSRALTPFYDPQTLRTRLIAATVELAAEGSNPRLVGTRHVRTAA